MNKTGVGLNTNKERIRFKFGIDRDQENLDVMEYQNTGNELIFEKIFIRRKPTFLHLAKKYKWLTEDAHSEILVVFVRTVNGYTRNSNKTDFNTFFFSSVKNHFSNVAKKKFRKKRTTVDGADPELCAVSLDSCIDESGGSSLFHELVASNDNTYGSDKKILSECIDKACDGNKFVSFVLSEMMDLTNGQIMRKKLVVDYSCPLITGDLEHDIRHHIGIPDELFEVERKEVKSDVISCSIKLDLRPFLDFLGNNMKKNGFVPDEVLAG